MQQEHDRTPHDTMDQQPSAPSTPGRDISLSRRPSNSCSSTFPARAQQAISDSNPYSPWSRKSILCLDGGGMKGYSTLLILKRLCVIIEEIETGRRPRINGKDYFELNTSSADYPWNCDTFGIRPKPHAFGPNDIIRKETRGQIAESVKRTFDPADGDRTGDFLLRHYFDYTAGTSTGGLSAILLSRMGMSIDMALAQYDVIGNSVFGRPRLLNRASKAMDFIQSKYSAKQMEDAICQVIANGLKTELSHRKIRPDEAPFQTDSPGSRTMVIAYGHAKKKNVAKEYLFRTYLHNYPSPALDRQARRKHLNPGLANPLPLYKVARATSAAPKYFPKVDIGGRSYLDGGMVANNPSRLALKEVEQMHEQLPKLLLSLGTGMPDDYERLDQDALLHGSYMIRGFGDTLKAISMLVTQTEKIHDDMSDLLANPRQRPGGVHRQKTEYFRFNVVGDAGEIPLDDWRGRNGEVTKARIRGNVMTYLSNQSVHEELIKCAQILVETRRARAETERWEAFAHEFAYFCPEKSCEKASASRIWFTRDELREHGTQEHYYISNIPIANQKDYPHACLFDSCRHAVTIFKTLDEFRSHLMRVHRIGRPIFKTVEEMERWLDHGRRTKKWAVDRADSNPQKLSHKRHDDLFPNPQQLECQQPARPPAQHPHLDHFVPQRASLRLHP
ncbi:FabD/lysophospholipase-like protein [Eremomyces bilateralis CBS 781.70]|uniref:FabD/lysophospholipase-like protein n=1 Tax=Eremomyces bilateralis CBS 781.70 TaxID=1392243 RepID=A0A6G1FUH2_9PEZI|nr:FabD/lysophospholipase-like protein [Eremomyces bilateralis CBS 781.70]KAF1809400.1 FabD/lysophospholipase-like protein [Eremomyces bilateralis CBS 781.70]